MQAKMTFTPYISIYFEDSFNSEWLDNHLMIKAIWIFSKNLGHDKKMNRKRVNIHPGSEEREYIKTPSNIKSVWLKNTIDTSCEVSTTEKLNQILKIIYSAMLNIGKVEGWNINLIEHALIQSVSDNGHFMWHSEIKSNKSKTAKARIKIKLDGDKAEVISEILDNSGNKRDEIKIIETFAYEIQWSRAFTKATWLDNENFGFSFLDSQLLIFANLKLNDAEIIIAENKSPRVEVESLLKRLTYKHFSNKKEVIDWMNR
ncbi:MAG: hypothetical protein ABIO56_10795 [Ferruginibacter sp.]